ncbi:MAG: glycoside hydrolase family 76 protein [Candidatus Omnitrophota bacterium]|nr:glycoside hydrolase family 76 protein [Candidatus Omnitrophota bacterium]
MKVAELRLEDRIDLAAGWFLNSGIQSEEGGFYAWQDLKDKSHPYIYSEITGYALTLMSFLYTVTKNELFIKKARHAAQWILQDALDASGAVLTRKYLKDVVEHYSFERGNIYSFDCAMVAFGMLKLHKITGEKDYLACAEKTIKFLNNRMAKDIGLYYPVFDTKKDNAYESPEKWSTQSGSFHSKLALCLCELASVKKDNTYNEMAAKLIDSSIKNFYKDKRFITGMPEGTSHLHPYSYTLEGMLYYSYKLKTDKYKDVMRDAFGWLARFQQENGGFPTRISGSGAIDIAHQRCDIQAQVLRLSHFIRSGSDNNKLLERLLSFQNVEQGSRGGFIYGSDQDGARQNHSNSWCSMFALQALYLAVGKINNSMVLEYII